MASQKTLLFMSIPTFGHIYPLVVMANELKELYGHRTIFMLPCQLNTRCIEENGHELIIAQSGDLEEARKIEKYITSIQWDSWLQSMDHRVRSDPLDFLCEDRRDNKGLATQAKNLMVATDHNNASLIEQIKPDLIVMDTWYILPSILSLKGIPYVYQSAFMVSHFLKRKKPNGLSPPGLVGLRLMKNRQERERLQREDPAAWEELISTWRHAHDMFEAAGRNRHEAFEKMYTDKGFPCHDPEVPDAQFSPYLNTYLWTKELDFENDDDIFEYPPRFFRCDSTMRPCDCNESEESRKWVNMIEEKRKGKKAVIYLSLGSLASGSPTAMKKLLAYARNDTSHLYVISLGPLIEQIKQDMNGDNMIGDRFLPQLAILPLVDLAIIHAGTNTVTECLHYGVPMIVMPCFGDHHDSAQRVVDLELGRKLSVTYWKREEMDEAIEDLLSDKALHERLKEISKKMKARYDLRKVAIMLDKLAREKQLDESFIDFCRDKHPDEILDKIGREHLKV